MINRGSVRAHRHRSVRPLPDRRVARCGPWHNLNQFTVVPFGGFFAGGTGFELPRHGISLLTVAVPVRAWLVIAALLARARSGA